MVERRNKDYIPNHILLVRIVAALTKNVLLDGICIGIGTYYFVITLCLEL